MSRSAPSPLSPLPPLTRRRLTATLCTAAHVVAAGCSSYRTASPTARPEVRATVRVRFAAPRPVTAVSGAGDTLEVPGVRALAGHVVSARGDTLVLRVAELEPRSDQVRGQRATIVRTAGDRVMVRQPDSVRSMLALVGIAAGAFALYAVGFVVAYGM